MTTNLKRGSGRAPLPRMLAIGALGAGLSACDLDKVLTVIDPEVATPSNLSPDLLFAGAVSDFQYAYSGGNDNQNEAVISITALFTDEFRRADTFVTRERLDLRNPQPTVQGNQSDFAYNRLQVARRSTHAALEAMPAGDSRISVLRALEGYTIMSLAENFCSAIPLITIGEGGAFVGGTALTTAQAMDSAVAKFDLAIAADASNTLARIGKARALLNANNPTAAAAAVAGIPTTYAIHIEHSSNSGREQNQPFGLQQAGRYGVANNEAGEGLFYLDDPRTASPLYRVGFDGVTPVHLSLRYPNNDADVPLATGVEARLIEAEAALRQNTPAGTATFLATLNALRADANSIVDAMFPDNTLPAITLAPLTDPGTQDARVDMLFAERGYWLHLMGYRLGDLRRMVRQYGRSQATVFPTDSDYGTAVSLPIPFNEQNNPEFDPSQCNVNQA